MIYMAKRDSFSLNTEEGQRTEKEKKCRIDVDFRKLKVICITIQ